MPAPLIGITTYGRDEGNRFPLPGEYVDSVRRGGGIPLLIPPGEKRIDALLAILDGVILAGGGDLDPAHYGGGTHESVYMLDAERDNGEMALAKRVIDYNIPTLGICRGAQVINVVLGGTLYIHLPDVVGETVVHRLPPREPTTHPVRVCADSRLGRILGREDFLAASWHHQAIRDPAAGLEVVAHAPDGTIEAVEMPAHPWLIAVQWHPELTSATDPVQQKLFYTFIQEAPRLRSQRKSFP